MIVCIGGTGPLTPVGFTALPSPPTGTKNLHGNRIGWRRNPETGRREAVVVIRCIAEMEELPGWMAFGDDE